MTSLTSEPDSLEHELFKLGYKELTKVHCGEGEQRKEGVFYGGHDTVDMFIRCTSPCCKDKHPIEDEEKGSIYKCVSFERHAGKHLSKKWKETIKTTHDNKRIISFIESSSAALGGDDLVERCLQVCWIREQEFFKGVIKSYDAQTSKYFIEYEDGDEEELYLGIELYKLGDKVTAENGQNSSPEGSELIVRLPTVSSLANTGSGAVLVTAITSQQAAAEQQPQQAVSSSSLIVLDEEPIGHRNSRGSGAATPAHAPSNKTTGSQAIQTQHNVDADKHPKTTTKSPRAGDRQKDTVAAPTTNTSAKLKERKVSATGEPSPAQHTPTKGTSSAKAQKGSTGAKASAAKGASTASPATKTTNNANAQKGSTGVGPSAATDASATETATKTTNNAKAQKGSTLAKSSETKDASATAHATKTTNNAKVQKGSTEAKPRVARRASTTAPARKTTNSAIEHKDSVCAKPSVAKGSSAAVPATKTTNNAKAQKDSTRAKPRVARLTSTSPAAVVTKPSCNAMDKRKLDSQPSVPHMVSKATGKRPLSGASSAEGVKRVRMQEEGDAVSGGVMSSHLRPRSSKVCIDNLGGCVEEGQIRSLLAKHLPRIKGLHLMSVALDTEEYRGGWGCITFSSEADAGEALQRLDELYLVTPSSPIPRPILPHAPHWNVYPWGPGKLPGHMDYGRKVEHSGHFAQPNHIDYDVALHWRRLNTCLAHAKRDLLDQHVAEIEQQMRAYCEEAQHPPAQPGSSACEMKRTPFVWLKGLNPDRQDTDSDMMFFEQFVDAPEVRYVLNPVTNSRWVHALLRMSCVHHAELLATNINTMVLLLHGTPRLVEAAVALAGGPMGSQCTYNTALSNVFGRSDMEKSKEVVLKVISGSPKDAADAAAVRLRHLMQRQALEMSALEDEARDMRQDMHNEHNRYFAEELYKLKCLLECNTNTLVAEWRSKANVPYDRKQLKGLAEFFEKAELPDIQALPERCNNHIP